MGEKKIDIKKLIKIVVLVSVVLAADLAIFSLALWIGRQTADFEKTSFFQYICLHKLDDKGHCSVCGIRCPHKNWSEDKTCLSCGYKCKHSEWEAGSCELCGLDCTHTEWKDGSCCVCGLSCEHIWEDGSGKCSNCGYECPHEAWEKGICSLCGYSCRHEDHDPDSLICSDCGEVTSHKLCSGKCSCGLAPELLTEYLPKEFFSDAIENAGTVEDVSYTAVDPRSSDPEDPVMIQRDMKIYLPYGYSEDQKYDILIMIPGGDDKCDSMIDKRIAYNGIYYTCKQVYDTLVAEEKMGACIIAAINTYDIFGGVNYKYEYGTLAAEIRDSILPYIVENYSTYALSGAAEDLIAARQHIAIGGISNGALYTVNMVESLLDICGNYIALSGNNIRDDLPAAFLTEANKELPVYCFYTGVGTEDATNYENVKLGYEALLEGVDRLRDGENLFYVETVDGNHSWATWTAQLYNALQLCFQDIA